MRLMGHEKIVERNKLWRYDQFHYVCQLFGQWLNHQFKIGVECKLLNAMTNATHMQALETDSNMTQMLQ